MKLLYPWVAFRRLVFVVFCIPVYALFGLVYILLCVTTLLVATVVWFTGNNLHVMEARFDHVWETVVKFEKSFTNLMH